jgi:hypothetical protein
MKSVMAALWLIIASILLGLGWWLEFGWVAGVTVGGTMAAGVLGVASGRSIRHAIAAVHRRRTSPHTVRWECVDMAVKDTKHIAAQ